MSRLLAIEWLKVRRYRTFWVTVGAFAILFPLLNYYVGSGLFGPASKMILGSTDSFATVWLNTCFYASHFVIFLALLLALLATNEAQFRTNRQNVIDGWSREQALHAKWSLVLSLSLGSTLLAVLVGLLQGLSQGAPFGSVSDGLENVLWLFLLTVNYLGIGLTAGLLLRRAGLTVILLFVYYMMVEPLLHAAILLKWQAPALDLLLPMEASDQLLPRPALSTMAKTMAPSPALPKYAYALGSLGWIAAGYALSRFRMVRKDL